MHWQGVGRIRVSSCAVVQQSTLPVPYLSVFLFSETFAWPLPSLLFGSLFISSWRLNLHLTSSEKSAPHQPWLGQVFLECDCIALIRLLKHSSCMPTTWHSKRGCVHSHCSMDYRLCHGIISRAAWGWPCLYPFLQIWKLRLRNLTSSGSHYWESNEGWYSKSIKSKAYPLNFCAILLPKYLWKAYCLVFGG